MWLLLMNGLALEDGMDWTKESVGLFTEGFELNIVRKQKWRCYILKLDVMIW